MPLQLLGLGGAPFSSTEALMSFWLATERLLLEPHRAISRPVIQARRRACGVLRIRYGRLASLGAEGSDRNARAWCSERHLQPERGTPHGKFERRAVWRRAARPDSSCTLIGRIRHPVGTIRTRATGREGLRGGGAARPRRLVARSKRPERTASSNGESREPVIRKVTERPVRRVSPDRR